MDSTGQVQKMRELGHKLDMLMKVKLTSYRYEHTKSVALISEDLAKRNGVKPEAAYLAGIYHDAMREESKDSLLALAKKYRLDVEDVEREYPVLLHGPVAARVLEEDYGVKDKSVLEAIACHTTGKAGMDDLAKIVYLADMIEPNRVYPGVERLRKLAYNDLEQAFYASVEHNILHVIDRKKKLHGHTVACWNDFIYRGGPIGIKGNG
jgi:predicted HD superfamily hydrolase involved in NAD metabolism